MSNDINANNFIFVIKNTNNDCSMKTYYSLLIVLSLIELSIEISFFKNIFLKTLNGRIVFILILLLSSIDLIVSLYYLLKFKICSKNIKEIINIISHKQIRIHKKIAKILMIYGFIITIIYFCFIFYNIFFNDEIFLSCEDLENKNTFLDILNLKSCQNNKCFNVENNYLNQNTDTYNYNYLCNFELNNYLFNNENNNIECKPLEKEKKKDLYTSSKSFYSIFKDKNDKVSKTLFNFLISCDYEFNKYLYICNSINKINDNEVNIGDIEIIDNYIDDNNIIDNLNESKKEKIYKKGECISLLTFILSIILNLVIFFTLPIKVDIWYNESKRFEIIKKMIHPNILRANKNNRNNNLDNVSIRTDNSSDKISDSSISENNQENNNIFEAVIQN